MGLLDNLFSDDPQKQATMAMALGLLGGNGKTNRNFGADLANAGIMGMGTYANAQQQQRVNRQSDLAQLTQTYGILKDQDQRAHMAAMVTGQPYVPDPALAQHEAKLAQLLNLPSLASKPAMPSTPQPMSLPAAQASQYSPAVRPELQAQGPMPQPQQPMDFRARLAAANIPPEVALGMINSGKGADLFKIMADAYVPKNGPGGVSMLGPNGPRIVAGSYKPGEVQFGPGPNGELVPLPIKGAQDIAAQAQAAVTNATEREKARYDLVSVPDGRGGTIMMPRLRATGDTGGQAPQQQSQPTGVAAPTFITQPGAAIGRGLSPAENAQQTKLAEFHAQNFIDTQVAGKQANSGLQKLDRIDQLMQGVDTGKLTPTGMQIAGYAQALGLPIDPKLGNKQAAEALTGQIALELRNPSGGAGMPGSLSDNDLKFLRSMTPGLAQTTEGRQMIIETKRKLLQRDQEVAQVARDYAKSHNGRLDNDFTQALQDYADAHPLFPQVKQQSGFKVLGVER